MAKTELEIPDEAALLEWKKKYSKSEGLVPKVHELRRFIVAFLMFLYPDSIIKKNINWKIIPCGWPPEVPFLDPNNKADGTTKPRKNDLECMYKYLVEKYKACQIKETVYFPGVDQEDDLLSAAGGCELDYTSFGSVPVPCQSTSAENESAFCYASESLPFEPFEVDENVELFSTSPEDLFSSLYDPPLWDYLGITSRTRIRNEDNLFGKSQVIHRNNVLPDENDIEAIDKLDSWDDVIVMDSYVMELVESNKPDRYLEKADIGNTIDSSKIPVELPDKIIQTLTEAPENENLKHFLENEAGDDGQPPGKRMKGKQWTSTRGGFPPSNFDDLGRHEGAKEFCPDEANGLGTGATSFRTKPRLNPKKTKVKMKRST